MFEESLQMEDQKNLRYIKSLTWDEVFSLWRDNEAHLAHWKEHYTQRGFTSWDDWRKNTLHEFNGVKLKWGLFEVISPLESVPSFYAGPFRAWMNKYYEGEKTAPFGKIINNKELKSSETIKQILENFPKETNLIGLFIDKKIIIIEGLHRCCAVALADKEHRTIDTKIYIALAECADEDLPIMGNPTSPT